MAKRLPAGTDPILDCHAVAILADTGPVGEKPIAPRMAGDPRPRTMRVKPTQMAINCFGFARIQALSARRSSRALMTT